MKGLKPMSTTNGNLETLRYGDHAIAVDELPDYIYHRLATRGLSHVLGNEVASKLSDMKEKRKESDLGPMTDTEIEVAKLDLQTSFIEAMKNGTWGTGTRGPSGPRVPAIEAEFNSVINQRVKAILDGAIKKAGGSFDKETKTWTWQMGDQTITRTLEQAAANYLADANYGEARRAEAMAQAEESLRVKQARAKAVEAAKAESVESLGI